MEVNFKIKLHIFFIRFSETFKSILVADFQFIII